MAPALAEQVPHLPGSRAGWGSGRLCGVDDGPRVPPAEGDVVDVDATVDEDAPGATDGAAEIVDDEAVRRRRRRVLVAFVVPMGVLQVLNLVGGALSPTLLVDAPLLLIGLNPQLRHLILVSPSVDPVPFFLVGTARLLLSDPLFFAFGRRYGDVGIRWLERKLGEGSRPVLWFETLFRRAAYPMVAIAPNNIICLLAGATGMRVGVFVALNVGGTVARLLLIRAFSGVFEGPILELTGWIADNRLWLTGLTIVAVAALALRGARRGELEIESPEDLEHELEEAEADLDHERFRHPPERR